MNFTIVVGNCNRVPTPHEQLKTKYSDLRREHRQTLDLLEMEEGRNSDLVAERLLLATLAYQLHRQLQERGDEPECEPEALALADAVVQSAYDVDDRCRCGSACHEDEGE